MGFKVLKWLLIGFLSECKFSYSIIYFFDFVFWYICIFFFWLLVRKIRLFFFVFRYMFFDVYVFMVGLEWVLWCKSVFFLLWFFVEKKVFCRWVNFIVKVKMNFGIKCEMLRFLLCEDYLKCMWKISVFKLILKVEKYEVVFVIYLVSIFFWGKWMNYFFGYLVKGFCFIWWF